MEELISVIVPIYKVEQYLNRCVDSIINQTYKNLEIILVDDGSPDKCGTICDEYAKKDSRIKVIHKENGGLSSARNAGLDVATGKYVSFIDSDDWIEKNSYELLKNLIETHKVDIVKLSGMQSVGNCINKKDNNFNNKTIDSFELLKNICLRKIGTSVCGSLWKKEIFENNRFIEGVLNEDFLFSVYTFSKNKLKVFCTTERLYTYFIRPGSISSGFGKSIVDAVYNTNKAIEIVKENAPELEKYCRGYNAYQARTALIMMPNDYRKNNKDFEKFCVKCIKENLKYADKSLLNKKDRIFCKLYFICPKLTKFISNII